MCLSGLLNAAPPVLQQHTAIPLDEIKLEDPLKLEQAAMEYILAYEAYLEARRSKEPHIRKQIVKHMQNYRESYARFLSLLRENKLYEPQKPKDPAGWYNKKHKKDRGNKRKWKKTDGKEVREQIKAMVEQGTDPDQVRMFIADNLPQTPLSIIPYASSTFPLGNNPLGNNPLGNNSGQEIIDITEDDSEDTEEDEEDEEEEEEDGRRRGGQRRGQRRGQSVE